MMRGISPLLLPLFVGPQFMGGVGVQDGIVIVAAAGGVVAVSVAGGVAVSIAGGVAAVAVGVGDVVKQDMLFFNLCLIYRAF